MVRPASTVIPGLGRDVKLSQTDFVAVAANPFKIDLFSRIRGATGLVMTATPADNVFATLVASHVRTIVSNTADGGTKTANGYFQFQLPENYYDGGAITLRIKIKLVAVTGTGVADNGSDIDALCYLQATGAVGSDLCATAAQTFAATGTFYTKDFVITPTGLVKGDMLNFEVVGRAIENDGGNGTLQVAINEISVLCETRG